MEKNQIQNSKIRVQIKIKNIKENLRGTKVDQKKKVLAKQTKANTKNKQNK